MSKATAAFQESVMQRSNEAKVRLDELFRQFLTTDESTRIERTKDLFESCEALRLMLASQFHPSWLKPLHTACKNYIHNPSGHDNALADVITRHFTSVVPIVLDEEKAETEQYDLDAIYQRVRDEKQLPQLFDKLVAIIRKIIDSGEIDSIAILDSLRELLDLLKSNRAESFASMSQSFSFTDVWCRKFLLKLLNRIPLVGEAVESLVETLEETKNAFEESSVEVERLMTRAILERFPILKKPADAIVSDSLANLTVEETPLIAGPDDREG